MLLALSGFASWLEPITTAAMMEERDGRKRSGNLHLFRLDQFPQ
jgi:hypothetical protein